MKIKNLVDGLSSPVDISTEKEHVTRLDVYKHARLLHQLGIIAGHKDLLFKDVYARTEDLFHQKTQEGPKILGHRRL